MKWIYEHFCYIGWIKRKRENQLAPYRPRLVLRYFLLSKPLQAELNASLQTVEVMQEWLLMSVSFVDGQFLLANILFIL